jgi:hypothetical protein
MSTPPVLSNVKCAGGKTPIGTTDACTDTAYPYVIDGQVKWLAPLPYGNPLEDWGSPPDARCHDCGIRIGSVHHWGCDYAKCPNCGLQLLGCECDMRSEAEVEKRTAPDEPRR